MSVATVQSGLLIGECRQKMRTMPESSVHCVVTSPPYWGLRDYGIAPVGWSDGSEAVLGLETTPELFIAHLIEVFQEVRRVLRDDGVCFVNLGDSYASGGKNRTEKQATEATGLGGGLATQQQCLKQQTKIVSGYKVGDLCNMPHRVAAAMQADGWYWRSTIIWHKRSPMPESLSGRRWKRCRKKTGRQPVAQGGLSSWDMGEHSHGESSGEYRGQEKTVPIYEDCTGCDKCRANNGYVLRRGKWRPTTSHEYVFMFSKSEKYFCDGDAVQELTTGNAHSRGHGLNPKSRNGTAGSEKQNSSFSSAVNELRETRNPRSVWSLSSEPYKGAHFATFPSQLVKRCIEAGTSSRGCCPECEAPYAPIVESQRVPTRPGKANKTWKHQAATNGDGKRTATSPNLDPKRHIAVTKVAGYMATCECGRQADIQGLATLPCVVFDPFAGSGTTLQTARVLGRRYVGCEINEEYAQLAEERIVKTPKWAMPKRTRRRKRKRAIHQTELF